jgi:hypothetical protein
MSLKNLFYKENCHKTQSDTEGEIKQVRGPLFAPVLAQG